MKVKHIAEELGRQSKVGIAVPASASEKEISFESVDEPAEHAIRRLASLCGFAAVLDGEVVLFVDKTKAMEGVTVIRAGFVDAAKAGDAVRGVIGEGAQVIVVGDRIVVAGSPAALQRAQQLREWFDRGADGWHLEIKLLRLSRSFAERIGVDWKLSANVKVGAGGIAGDFIPAPLVGARAEAVIEAVTQLSQSDTDASVVYSSPLLVLEGRAATISQGDRVPILKKAVSDQGTVTTTGYEVVDTGFKCEALATRVPGGVLLELTPELSAVTGLIGDIPVLSRSSLKASCVVRSGEWIVLGGLETAEQRKSRTAIPGIGGPPIGGSQVHDLSDGTLLFLVRATRVFAAH